MCTYCYICVGGKDYKRQQYRDVRFARGGSRYYELKTEFMDDDEVEDDECYYLIIETSTLPDRVVAVSPNMTKVCLTNDDGM